MSKRIGVVALVVVMVASACAGSDAVGDDSFADGGAATDAPSTPGQPSDAGSPSLDEFCMQFEDLQGEVPESYVGSPEHLAVIEELLAVTPGLVSAEVLVFRDYLASGAIDSASDPESNMTANWPVEVQAAITTVQAFGAENC